MGLMFGNHYPSQKTSSTYHYIATGRVVYIVLSLRRSLGRQPPYTFLCVLVVAQTLRYISRQLDIHQFPYIVYFKIYAAHSRREELPFTPPSIFTHQPPPTLQCAPPQHTKAHIHYNESYREQGKTLTSATVP